MNEEIILNHVALQFSDLKLADIFFTKVLKIPKVKSFTLSQRLSEDIFGITNEAEIVVYSNEKICFEIFISKEKKEIDYSHTCIEVADRKKFMMLCKENGLNPYIVKKGEKELLFVKDFSNNLYEIKDKQNL